MIESVLFVVRSDDTFPSCRFRAYQYQRPLERLGVRVGYLRAERSMLPHKRLHFARELVRCAKSYHAVVYQKLLHPVLVRAAALANPNLFYDFDDALWLSHPHLQFAWTLKAAPHVIAGNPYLGAMAERYNEHVSVVPTTVLVPKHFEAPPARGPMRLLWVGSACNLHYLEPARRALRRLRKEGADIELHIVTESPHRATRQEGVTVERWSRQAEERSLLHSHVGLMPLNDDAWSRGKCACKALQSLSYGRPVVASPVGVNADVLSDSTFATLPRRPDDWYQAIADLASDRPRLPERGRAGREMVTREFTVDVWAPRLMSILSQRGEVGVPVAEGAA